jgi:hypothetical protein
MDLPSDHLMIHWDVQETNFVQAVEGGIDSAHINYLHASLNNYYLRESPDQPPTGVRAARQAGQARLVHLDKHPRMFAKQTEYGVAIGAGRTTEAGDVYWRINQFWMPFYTQPPSDGIGGNFVMFIPLDELNTARWIVQYRFDRAWEAAEIRELDRHQNLFAEIGQPLRRNSTDLPTRHYRKRNYANDYLIDREVQRQKTFTGIVGVGEQDSSIQEGMGPIVDRENEHLGTTDIGIIQMRRRLLDAATELERGVEPFSATHPEVYAVRAGSVILEAGKDWLDADEALQAQQPRTLGATT